ncbi:peptidase S41 [Nonomuraea sp. NN258]|uniref:S41 family peptidase n=1 Tax=Nonomuraea antri TaxID=2730852 RepID=UPI0015686DED|nr:S41 family peptidase [Nonomuraea antri]NRQ36313.1 peptidase S41 [Nonomuraea antri]
MTNLPMENLPAPSSKELAAAVPLSDFLDQATALSPAEREKIATQALLALEQNYANLPLKATRYAINPLQRLRLMIARMGMNGAATSEWQFHEEMIDLFNSLRDLHTRYTLPARFADAVAFLPFRVKHFVKDGELCYLVAPERQGPAPAPTDRFRPGVQITHWNGVPMERAVQRFAARMPGANPAARHARALDFFTIRVLAFTGPPDEEAVLIDYIDLDGDAATTKGRWLVPGAPAEPVQTEVAIEPERTMAMDIEARQLARLKASLFAPHTMQQQASGQQVVSAAGDFPIENEMAQMFEARVVNTPSGDFGYLRLRSFHPEVQPASRAIELFVNEFIRLLGLMPDSGVILDIRGNHGGYANAAELCLQALIPGRLDSEPMQLLSSPLNLRICRANTWMNPWIKSLEHAVETGAPFSAGVPLTDVADLDKVPHAYLGPLLLLTDARSYSAADIFAAGFQDHEIGTVIGVDKSTGAGGAAVWDWNTFLRILPSGQNPYQELPAQADLTIAFGRLLRVRANAGVAIEDFGVEADEVHPTTRDDVMHNSRDLLARAGRALGAGVRRTFDVELVGGGLRVTAAQVDRADVLTDGRPRLSADLGAAATIEVPGLDDARTLRVEGFAGGRLVAVRTFVRGQDGTLTPVTRYTP